MHYASLMCFARSSASCTYNLASFSLSSISCACAALFLNCRNLLKTISCFLSITLHCNRYSPRLGIFLEISFGDCPQNELATATAAVSIFSHASMIAARVEKESKLNRFEDVESIDNFSSPFSFAIASTVSA